MRCAPSTRRRIAGAFARPRRRLGLSELAVSHQVRKLETYLAVQLFERGRQPRQPDGGGAALFRPDRPRLHAHPQRHRRARAAHLARLADAAEQPRHAMAHPAARRAGGRAPGGEPATRHDHPPLRPAPRADRPRHPLRGGELERARRPSPLRRGGFSRLPAGIPGEGCAARSAGRSILGAHRGERVAPAGMGGVGGGARPAAAGLAQRHHAGFLRADPGGGGGGPRARHRPRSPCWRASWPKGA